MFLTTLNGGTVSVFNSLNCNQGSQGGQVQSRSQGYCWLFSATSSWFLLAHLCCSLWITIAFSWIHADLSYYGPQRFRPGQCLRCGLCHDCGGSFFRWWWKVGTGSLEETCRCWTGSTGRMDWISTDWHPPSSSRSLKRWMQVDTKLFACACLFSIYEAVKECLARCWATVFRKCTFFSL